MRLLALLCAVATVLVVFAVPVPAQSVPAPAVRIVEILPDPDTALGQREFVELANLGNTTVDLLGWKVRDAPTASGAMNAYPFPSWRLAPGERVVVWGGGAADAYGPAWSNSAVWNNAGDGATLLDASGRAVDYVGHGATAVPSAFPNATLLPKPDKGSSLALDGAWKAGSPTPGLAPGMIGSQLNVQVANAAPAASFVAPPPALRPGAASIAVVASDPNGLADLAQWSLALDGVVASNGQGAPPATVPFIMPGNRTSVSFLFTVQDVGGLAATAQATVGVRWSDLDLVLPDAGLGFPDLVPGTTVTSLNPIHVHNAGSTPRAAVLDLGHLRGPSEHALEGAVEIGVLEGNATRWVPYGAPLASLAVVPPGGDVAFLLRIHVPDGLAAGRYGASLAVAG